MIPQDNRPKLVFLGTPQVAQLVLKKLVEKKNAFAKVILVVTQPPARSTRNGGLTPSPVQEEAHRLGIPVLCPVSAKDPQFLQDLAALQPDLCITAAYGQYLPKAFLSIPRCGTVNIHPSLLPLYRGAAPVQRTLENGDAMTGVTLLYTVQEMDAGPIIAQKNYPLDDSVKSQELLNILFDLGAELLCQNLSKILRGDVQAIQQDPLQATHAKKIAGEESQLNFELSAKQLHNKVRAFAGWPGTKMTLSVDSKKIECKVIQTEIGENSKKLKPFEVSYEKNSIDIGCGDGLVLKVLELQPSGKKALLAKEFQNGAKGTQISIFH